MVKVSKRGEGELSKVTGTLVWIGIILLVAAVLLVYINSVNISGVNLDGLPDAVRSAYDTVIVIVGPIVEGIYWLAAPSGQSENVQMIAFAIFLLLTLVGTTTLRPFFSGPFFSFFIAAIVGLIAARSLTATILENTALAASPIAAVSLLLGFLPVFVISKNIDSWHLTQYSKLVVFTVAGFVYALIFGFGFNAWSLGITYGVGICLLGAGQVIAPHFRKGQEERKNESLGRYMAGVHKDLAAVEGMEKGSRS